MKQISVIVPIYNVQDYLRNCLDSLYKQWNPSIEVILVNDGSTDFSLSICKEYQKNFPETIIINKPNGGLSDARNAGTAIATGEFIYYMDSDDWLAADALKTLLCFAIKNHCDVVQGGFYYAYDDYLLLDERYVKAGKEPFVLARTEAMTELIKQQYIKNFAWGKLYKTDIIKGHPFPKGKFYEDSFWQHLIIHETKTYGVIPSPLYYYRQRKGGISGEFSERNMDLLMGNEQRLLFISDNYPELKEPMAAMLWKLCSQFNDIAKRCGKKDIKLLYEEQLQTIEKKYHPLLHKDAQYRISHHLQAVKPLCQLVTRVYNRLFGKKLTKIELS